jgi:hypothetical protein
MAKGPGCGGFVGFLGILGVIHAICVPGWLVLFVFLVWFGWLKTEGSRGKWVNGLMGQGVKRSRGQEVKRSRGQEVKRSRGQEVKRSRGLDESVLPGDTYFVWPGARILKPGQFLEEMK